MNSTPNSIVRFKIQFAPELVMDASLINVSDLTEIGGYESFMLTFLVPKNVPSTNRSIGIGHPEIGEMELFIVPSGKDEKGTTYVSVFNYKKE